MSKRVQLNIAILLVIGGLAWLFGASFIRHSLKSDHIGEAGFPVILGVVVVVAGVTLVIRYYRALRAEPDSARPPAINEPGDDEPKLPASNVRPIVMWAFCGAWTIVVEPVGFLIATPVLIGIELWLLEFRRPVPVVLLSVVGALLIWIAFDFLLMINLPGGLLAPLTDGLRL